MSDSDIDDLKLYKHFSAASELKHNVINTLFRAHVSGWRLLR